MRTDGRTDRHDEANTRFSLLRERAPKTHLTNAIQIFCINTITDPNYLKKRSPYRAVNTLRFGYKNQSVNAV